VAAWSWGEPDRPAVLLVHGWAGRGSQLGAFAGALAASGLRAVTFDAPGHGESQGRRSSLLAMSDALLAVAESAGAVAGVVAHSAGAAAATWALRRGLAESAARTSGAIPVERASGATRVERASGVTPVERASGATRVVYIAPPAELSSYASTFAAAIGLPAEIAGRIQTRIERRFGLRWDELHGVGVARAQRAPLLVVHDRDDAEVALADGAALAAAWPGARLIATAGLGHRRLLRDPEVVRAVVDYLTGAEDAAASA
jgi:pimeloyl-ACP methyl ester carboxylesterase